MVKGKPEKGHGAGEQQCIRNEIRKEWGTMEPKLIEMAHKLEDNGLIESKDYVYIRNRISG